jgi:transketolase
MRNTLSELIAESAGCDPNYIVLSGDHGYALFDSIRKLHPVKFINVGVMEQAMVGIAAGLCKQGFKPMVYGLAAFVPIRVLEQIKLDICYPKLPVTFIGDGAGLVYSTLGVSHQCAEDVAALRSLPHLRIYSPCDAFELSACYAEAQKYDGPAYLRIGKGDRPAVNTEPLKGGCDAYFTHQAQGKNCLVATGAMVSITRQVGQELGLSVLSVPRLKPVGTLAIDMLDTFTDIIVVEEHSRYGGLASILAEIFSERPAGGKRIRSVALKEKFSERCGTYQYALSEHDMADHQLKDRISALIN